MPYGVGALAIPALAGLLVSYSLALDASISGPHRNVAVTFGIRKN